MLTKCKEVRPQKGVNNPLKNVFMFKAKFFQEGGTQIRRIFMGGFSAELFLSILIIEKALGSGGMLPRKFFENLHTVEAILVLFEQFLENFI